MYTLNLLFNFGQTNGRFDGDKAGGVLGKSKNWLRLKTAIEPEPANPDPAVFDPERPAIWKDLGEAGTLLLHRTPADPGTICIRVAASPVDATTVPPTPALPANATVQLVVTFGRPVRANQSQASPFVDGAEPSVKTTFVFGPIQRNSPAAAPVAWFFPLGKIAPPAAGRDPDLADRYEFSVGVIVTSGGLTRHYGEDPEMDVGQ